MEDDPSQYEKSLMERITDPGALENSISLFPEEKEYFFRFSRSASSDAVLPFAVTEYYLSLISRETRGPLRRQCIPEIAEFSVLPYETPDPLYEEKFSPLPRMVHRYRDRILVLVSDCCAMYCRHCFRRHFAGRGRGFLLFEEAENIAYYLKEHTEVHEVILSGGDPLMLPDEKLGEFLALLKIRRPVVFRLATRMPAVSPSRITESLINVLSLFKPLWIVTQFNHPREITEESSSALTRFVEKGFPVLNQTVLMKGINDKPEILALLFHRLLELSVKPYYLFQGDLASGTSHFRVPLEKSFTIYEALGKLVSGSALPVFAADLPGGGGKIHLQKSSLKRKDEEGYVLTDSQGKEYCYPAEG